MQRRSRTILTYLSSATLLAVLGEPGHAAEETPSLSETVAWLRGQFPQYVEYEVEHKSYSRVAAIESLESCQLTITDKMVRGGTLGEIRMEVALSALDPTHIQLESLGDSGWLVTAPTRNGASVVKMTQQKKFLGHTKAIWLAVGDTTLAERVKKAWAHTIRLCGGKDDPF